MRLRLHTWHLVPVLALVALLAWAFASPVGSSPDDDFHLASIWCAGGDHSDTCQPGDTARERKVPIGIAHANCFAGNPNKTAACQSKYLDRDQNPTVETMRGSFANNYPPIYYATMGLLASPNIEVSVVLMRLLNIVLLLGITTALAVLLPVGRRVALLVPWVVTTVPLGIFLLTSNNPSSWALIGIGSAWIALLGYFETTGRRRIALGALFALAGIMAAGARGDSAIYLVLSVAIVLFLKVERDRGFVLRAILPLALAVIAVVFFATSQQVGVASSGLGPVPGETGPPPDTASLVLKDFLNVPSLWFGAFGRWDLGWLDTAMPGVVQVGATAGFLLIAAMGLARTSWRKGLMAVGVFVVLWLLPTYVLVVGGNQVGENVQPRYLLPLILLLAGLLMLDGRDGMPVPLPRWVVVVAACGIGLANAVALYFDMRRYIVGSNGNGASLDGRGGWWWHMPISPMTVWVVGSLAFGAMLVLLVREVRRRRELILV